jgi:hypothetical protein
VSDWGRRTFGDPCRECSFDWSLSFDEIVDLVRSLPAGYAATLAGCDGSESIAALEWPAISYVCHVVDNLRIWAERRAVADLGGRPTVASYDNDGLAAARNYVGVPLSGALWSRGRAATDWQEAAERGERAGVVLLHPDRGPQTVLDAIGNNAHDAFHHHLDLTRIVSARLSP